MVSSLPLLATLLNNELKAVFRLFSDAFVEVE